jgi:hypothetical protein
MTKSKGLRTGIRRDWEAWEDETIKRMWCNEGAGHKEIAEAIGRPKGSIGTRIVLLGLKGMQKKEEKVESKIGTVIHRGNVTIHIAKEKDDRRGAQLRYLDGRKKVTPW